MSNARRRLRRFLASPFVDDVKLAGFIAASFAVLVIAYLA